MAPFYNRKSEAGGGTGTVTEVSSANTDIGVATGTTTPVLTLNSGTSANQIVKLDASAKLPAVDGSQLTNLPTGGDMLLGTVQSVTAEKKFDKDKLSMKGTSTGKNIISVANTSATDYTNTLPAKDGTIAMTSDIPDVSGYELLSNKSTNVITDGASDTKYSSVKSVKTYADGKNSLHGVVSRPVGATNPLPTFITTPVFTLGATANNISYYYQGELVNVTTDKVTVLDDSTGATTTSGLLVSGKYYILTTYVAGDDFSNIDTVISGTTNTTGCIFLTTGTTPTTWTNGSSVRELVNSQGVYYVAFSNGSGNTYATKIFPGVASDSNVLLATVTWNGTDYGLVADERHGYTRNKPWHIWAHNTVGCRYRSGLILTASGTGASATFATTAGEIADEDIQFVVPASSAFPTANAGRLFWQTSATQYSFNKTPSTVPFYRGANNRPNYVRSDTFATVEMTSAVNRYINIFVYATTSLHTPIYFFTETVTPTIAGTNGYTSLANARAIPFPNLTGLGVSPELKPIYRLIIRADGVVQTIDTTLDDYRTVSSLPMSAGITSSTAGSISFNVYDDITNTTVQTAIEQLADQRAKLISPTFATSITGSYLTASELLGTGASKEIVSLPVATYPSLTELSYVKGVTSAIQTQLGGKVPTGAVTTNGITMATGKLLGRNTASTGAIEEITLGTNLSMTGTTLNAAGSSGGEIRIRIPGEMVADANIHQGVFFRNVSGSTITISNVKIKVASAASGAGASAAFNIYKSSGTDSNGIDTSATALFNTAIDLTTNYTDDTNAPDTATVEDGRWISARCTASAGATTKASDVEIIIIYS